MLALRSPATTSKTIAYVGFDVLFLVILPLYDPGYAIYYFAEIPSAIWNFRNYTPYRYRLFHGPRISCEIADLEVKSK